MKKKIISVLVAAMILVVTAIPAFASTELNDYEKQVLNKIDADVSIGGAMYDLSSFYGSVRNYFLMSNVIDTQAEATDIINAVDAVATKLTTEGFKASADGKSIETGGVTGDKTAIKDTVLAQINTTATKYDMNATYDVASKTLTIKDKNDILVASNSLTINDTGASNMILPIAIGSVFAVALIGTSVYVFKNKKVAD